MYRMGFYIDLHRRKQVSIEEIVPLAQGWKTRIQHNTKIVQKLQIIGTDEIGCMYRKSAVKLNAAEMRLSNVKTLSKMFAFHFYIIQLETLVWH